MSHIADIDYVSYISEECGGTEVAEHLYRRADESSDPTAKRIIHQTCRMIFLADRMDEIAKARPALKILFFVILAEAAAKLCFRYEGERDSKAHVLRFFNELCLPEDRAALSGAFRRNGPGEEWFSTDAAARVLYAVRNDVAHRGQYFLFKLAEPWTTITPFEDDDLEVQLSEQALRGIVFRGALQAAERALVPSA